MIRSNEGPDSDYMMSVLKHIGRQNADRVGGGRGFILTVSGLIIGCAGSLTTVKPSKNALDVIVRDIDLKDMHTKVNLIPKYP